MITVGVICEYNPFHIGHKYHLDKIKDKYGSDCKIICLMNGNYTQRGTPAVFDKYVRAAAAVRGGADVVLELPFPYGCCGADYYARNAVYCLSRLGIDVLSFGCESEISELIQIADALNTAHADRAIGEIAQKMSYAKAREKTMESMGKKNDNMLLPNNILAIEYIKAVFNLAPHIELYTVRRVGSYHSVDNDVLPSASQIRFLFDSGNSDHAKKLCGDNYQSYEREIKEKRTISLDYFSKGILSALCSKELLLPAFESNKEINDRIKKYARSAISYDLLLDACSTARYTTSRMRRAILHTSLGTDKHVMDTAPTFLILLAFSQVGRDTVKNCVKKSEISVLTKPSNAYKLNKIDKGQVALWAKADRFYALCRENNTEGDIFLRSHPFCD